MLTRRDGLRLTLGLAATLEGGPRPGFVESIQSRGGCIFLQLSS